MSADMIAAQKPGTGYDIEVGVTGCIRWYNAKQGQGYIIPDDGKGDVLFNSSNAKAWSPNVFIDGALVIFDRYLSDRGYRGLRVRLYAPSCCPTCGRPMGGGK